MDMKLVRDSDVLNTFISDSRFLSVKAKPLSNINHTMEKKIKNSFYEPKK